MQVPNEKILLPNVIQANARANPTALFARIPAGSKYTDGYRDITRLQLHNAVNHTASLIRRTLGESQTFEALAYIGPGDLRYSILVVAGIKTGYKVFLPSPRNSQEAHVSLLEELKCTKLVLTEPQAPCIPSILDEVRLSTMVIPSLHQLLEVSDVEEYRYDKSFQGAKSDPAFVLHTSGSTGIPKLLTFTNEFISRVIAASSITSPEGYKSINQYVVSGKFFITLPPFHIAGLAYSLFIPAYHGSNPVYTLPGPPPSTESIISAISNTSVDWAFVPPVFIDELGKRSDLLDIVSSRLKYLFFTGGSVPKVSGDIVAQKLPIWQVLGSSECGSLPLVHPKSGYLNSEEWNLVQLHPLLKAEMRHRFEDLSELVIVRGEDTEAIQPVFTHFPEAAEYETRDLFRPHSLNQKQWAYHGRIDDVIVFLNGEKTNPVTFEEQVIGHPEVKAALVNGTQRLEAALVVELTTPAQLSEPEKNAVIQRIWPFVAKANAATPAHARVSKSKILILDSNMPMLRAGKGTVQRKATLNLYAGEIEKLYGRDETFNSNWVKHSAHDSTQATIRSIVAEMLGLDDLDFFQLGMDSLGVLRLHRALKSRFPGTSTTLETIYSNSSVNALAATFAKSPLTDGNATKSGKKSSTGELAKLLEDLSRDIDDINPIDQLGALVSKEKHMKVFLTGSTGALGSYILDRLLLDTEVVHIYCFNRTTDAKDRQIEGNQRRGLATDFPSQRVTFFVGDLAKPGFGLSDTDYQMLLFEVTHVIHNAWPVNFNRSLASYTLSLSGVVSLIRFSTLSRWNAQIAFFSSISSVSSYDKPIVPEDVINELSAPASMGYGQSKYLAERLLHYASKTLGIKTEVFRIGQIAGAAGTTSGWNKQEWLPSLVISSAFIGTLPETLGNAPATDKDINWVPIDQLADVVVELALHPEATNGMTEQGFTVFHVVHPNPVSWSFLIPTIQNALQASLSSSHTIQLLPYETWLSALKARSAEIQTGGESENLAAAQQIPAMKLIDFYDGLQHQGHGGLRIKLDLEKTVQCSKILKSLGPLQGEWLTGWVKEWINNICS